jgi:RNA polymerase sigma-70 factor, ECF subfamily
MPSEPCAADAALADCASWVDALADGGPAGEPALLRLRALLVAVGWFELERRRAQLAGVSVPEAARLVRDAADVACATLLTRLDDYHGQSRFEVWAAKFAIHEAAAAARRSGASAGKSAAARDTNGGTDIRAGGGGAT